MYRRSKLKRDKAGPWWDEAGHHSEKNLVEFGSTSVAVARLPEKNVAQWVFPDPEGLDSLILEKLVRCYPFPDSLFRFLGNLQKNS